ncbi:MAG: glycosyltransferase family 4 protein, partial [Candidatus Dormibacteraeota bacterium]|nr:glycosyltransferase family 4 protein [Candidatus Dormibacteraeota bacterium]
MRPRRVAWFGHASGSRADGLSTYSREHVVALTERGITVKFFAHTHDGFVTPVPHPVMLRAGRFKTVRIPLPGTAARVAMELERFHPDVVHLSLSFSLLDGWILAECRRRRMPSVVTVHLPYAAPSSARGRVLRELYRFHATAMLSADRVIALSPEQSSLLRSVGCDPSRIMVLPNSIDTAAFAPGVSALRERLGADFVVAYAGRLDPEKRVTALVESFRRQPWNSRCALVIAGSGSQERQVRRA